MREGVYEVCQREKGRQLIFDIVFGFELGQRVS